MRMLTISLALSLGSLLAFACDSGVEDPGSELELRKGPAAAAECKDDSDCNPGEVCEPSGPGCGANACVPGCHEDADCSPGQDCTIVECITCPCPGYCESNGPVQCKDDDDCGPGTVCEPEGPGCGPESYCVAGCHDDDDCGPGHSCDIVQCFTCPCPGICD